eukprot:CAMPEP_0195261222 /NCGR_PEP_ID=MMETSP0706-20130129/9021_1 /TAXON_ID=33640 /ORGANISM="Asterionellopsis glacialis, Strain CCMP134" /LENGTH=62 /DNA_ID=CAMNT_0040315051 /DNA_START=440 /DNA_END=628 /DNA_ORIENTATION=-
MEVVVMAVVDDLIVVGGAMTVVSAITGPAPAEGAVGAGVAEEVVGVTSSIIATATGSSPVGM